MLLIMFIALLHFTSNLNVHIEVVFDLLKSVTCIVWVCVLHSYILFVFWSKYGL